MTNTVLAQSKSLRGLVVGLVLILAPHIALADKARGLLDKAVQHYVMVDFKKSLRVLKKAQKATRDSRLLGQILLYTGCNHAELGQMARARRAFTIALAHDPLLKMEQGRFKDVIEKLFREVRGAARGELIVTADRAGAVVVLDSSPAGTAPLKKKVSIGRHEVRVITTDGRFGLRDHVVVAPGRTTRLKARLLRLQGLLTITTRPAGATVVLEGKPLGKSPLVRVKVNTGKLELVLRLERHRPVEVPVSVAWDRESSVARDLEPEPPPASAPASQPVATSQPIKPAESIEPATLAIARYERRSKTVHGVVALGLGGVAAVTAAVLFGVARGQGDEAYDQYAAATNPNAITRHWDEVEAAETMTTASGVLLGVAAVCAGYGLYQILTRPEVPASRQITYGVRVGLVPLGRGAGAVLGGEF